MASDDWYRGRDWADVYRDEFERKLARARTYNRSQYLLLQAGALASAGTVDVARGLLHRSIAAAEDLFNLMRASLALADLEAESGDLDEAIANYRMVAESRFTFGDAEPRLAHTLVQRGGEGDFAEAKDVIDRFWKDSTTLPNDTQYEARLVQVKCALHFSDHSRAAAFASHALELAAAVPALSHKPYFGVVTASDSELDWLRSVAGH